MTMGKVRSLLKSWARYMLFPAVEAAWAALFRLVGLVLRPQGQEWSSPGGETVLVVAPHPDDETLGCGGTIALHRAAGNQVYVLIVTDGGSSGAGALGREEISRRRSREAKEAIAALGKDVELIQLALPEGLWAYEELVGVLGGTLTRLKPGIVYTTSCVDYYPEHVRVGAAVADALAATRGRNGCRVVRAYEVQVPLTPLLANVVADVHDVEHLKRRALQAYATQLPGLLWAHRQERYQRAIYGRKGAVEAFWQMRPGLFCRVMERGRNSTYPVSPYRGLRPRPFTDGLAWLVGTRDRRRLRRLTTS